MICPPFDQVNNDPTNYGHLVDGNGDWVVRDDAWVWSIANGAEKKGNLTTGFGSSNTKIGPEFGFGSQVADHYDEQVLLIKAAWGGKSLGKDFRSPTAVTKRGGTVGFYYNEILNVYNNVIDNIATEFPDYNGQGVELVGFGWHQGYNDRGNNTHAADYEANLVDFIADMRNDLGVSDLPFVIAETGNGGVNETGANALAIMAAQEAVANPDLYPEHEGNVAFVETQGFWRDSSVSPLTSYPHWNDNGESYYLMGAGMGEAMVQLVPEPSSALLFVTAGLLLARRRRVA